MAAEARNQEQPGKPQLGSSEPTRREPVSLQTPAPDGNAPATTRAEQPYHVLPHTVSRHFQDPNHYLGQLRQHLQTSGQVAVVAQAALYGMGGLGKTQLALKYSVDHRADYAGVWWFRAETASALQEDTQRCCEKLGIAIAPGVSPTQALCRWLEQQRGRWLLVYDNVETPADLPDLPQQGGHHLLFTSRNPNWQGYAQPLKLVPWSDEQGATFLQQRLGGDVAAYQALSHELGGLPLALEQAAGYLEETGCSVAEYRSLLADVKTEGLILDHGPDQNQKLPTKYERSVAATLSLAYAKLTPAAQQLLCLCAFAAPEPIPERLFREAADELPTELQAAAGNVLAWNQTVAQLRAYGLVERGNISDLDTPPGETAMKQEHTLQFHRLTQQVTRAQRADNIPALAGPAHAQAWLAVLRQACPQETDLPQHWARYRQLVPHIEVLPRYLDSHELWFEWVNWLLDRVANYLRYGPALYASSVVLCKQGLALCRARLGDEHPNTLTTMANLAEALVDQGDLPGARALQEQVLAISRRVWREEDPGTLISMNNLALTLLAQGDLPGARVLLEQVLTIRRRSLGEEHLKTLVSMSNLAELLRVLGDLSGARALQVKVLTCQRRSLGEEHPDTLIAMNNLATTLHAQGDLPGARVLQEQMLTISRWVLGEEHPKTLTAMTHLSKTMWYLGEHMAAIELMRAAAQGRLHKLGPEHPDTVSSQQALQQMTDDLKDLP